jgi:hypothetical protein
VVRGLGSVGDVGGVGGPVAAGYLLPGHRDADVDAEYAGQDRGGQFGGQVQQGGVAGVA